jgi:magnesium chelatase family protein
MEFPARVSVIASMNPCPCGFYGDNGRMCSCTPLQINSYKRKLSGPLLDRFDLQVEVPRISYDELKQGGKTESSNVVRERVMKARQKQWQRFGSSRTNAEMTGRETKETCVLDKAGESLFKKVFEKKFFSARAHEHLRVARTIADCRLRMRSRLNTWPSRCSYRALDREKSIEEYFFLKSE